MAGGVDRHSSQSLRTAASLPLRNHRPFNCEERLMERLSDHPRPDQQ